MGNISPPTKAERSPDVCLHRHPEPVPAHDGHRPSVLLAWLPALACAAPARVPTEAQTASPDAVCAGAVCGRAYLWLGRHCSLNWDNGSGETPPPASEVAVTLGGLWLDAGCQDEEVVPDQLSALSPKAPQLGSRFEQ